MSAEDLKKLISDGYKLFQAGDISTLLDRYHDDAEWIGPDSDYVPYAGSYHGKQGIAEFFSTLGKTVQATHFEPRRMVAECDTVVVTGESSWIVRSNGLSYNNPFVHVFKIRDGKVQSMRAYWDTSPAEHALHPTPAELAARKPIHH